jgi:hypothetical protein
MFGQTTTQSKPDEKKPETTTSSGMFGSTPISGSSGSMFSGITPTQPATTPTGFGNLGNISANAEKKEEKPAPTPSTFAGSSTSAFGTGGLGGTTTSSTNLFGATTTTL